MMIFICWAGEGKVSVPSRRCELHFWEFLDFVNILISDQLVDAITNVPNLFVRLICGRLIYALKSSEIPAIE